MDNPDRNEAQDTLELEWHRPIVAEIYLPKMPIRTNVDRLKWMDCLHRDRRMTERGRRLLLRLVQFLNLKTGLCFPSMYYLAVMAGLDGDTATRMARLRIAEGERAGWIRRHLRRGGHKANRSNTYEFCIPAAATIEYCRKIELETVERGGKWYVAQPGGLEVCGPFKTRNAAESWATDRTPECHKGATDRTPECHKGATDRTPKSPIIGEDKIIIGEESKNESFVSKDTRQPLSRLPGAPEKEPEEEPASPAEVPLLAAQAAEPQGGTPAAEPVAAPEVPITPETAAPYDDEIVAIVRGQGRWLMSQLIRYSQDVEGAPPITSGDIRRLIRSGRLVEKGIYISADEDEEDEEAAA
jgi:hypothetical protein